MGRANATSVLDFRASSTYFQVKISFFMEQVFFFMTHNYKNQLWKSSTELLNWISTHRGFQSVSESRSGVRDLQLLARYYRSWPVAQVEKSRF